MSMSRWSIKSAAKEKEEEEEEEEGEEMKKRREEEYRQAPKEKSGAITTIVSLTPFRQMAKEMKEWRRHVESMAVGRREASSKPVSLFRAFVYFFAITSYVIIGH